MRVERYLFNFLSSVIFSSIIPHFRGFFLFIYLFIYYFIISFIFYFPMYYLSFYLFVAVVQASNCGPSILALLHGNMIKTSIVAIQHSKSKSKSDTRNPTTTTSSHAPYNNSNRNNTLNNGKSSNAGVGNIDRNENDSSPLIKLLTSSSFSTNDAHSLPPEIREVSLLIFLYERNKAVVMSLGLLTLNCMI